MNSTSLTYKVTLTFKDIIFDEVRVKVGSHEVVSLDNSADNKNTHASSYYG